MLMQHLGTGSSLQIMRFLEVVHDLLVLFWWLQRSTVAVRAQQDYETTTSPEVDKLVKDLQDKVSSSAAHGPSPCLEGDGISPPLRVRITLPCGCSGKRLRTRPPWCCMAPVVWC